MTQHNSADCLCPGGINVDLGCDVDALRGWVTICMFSTPALPCPEGLEAIVIQKSQLP